MKKKAIIILLIFFTAISYSQTYEYNYTLGVSGVSGSDNSHFNEPSGIDFDSNFNIYVTDRNNQRVQIFSPNGIHFNSFSSGSGNYNFNFVNAIAIDNFDNLFLMNDNTQEIFKYDAFFNYVTEISHNGVGDIATDGNNIYSTWFNMYNINIYNNSLILQSTFGTNVSDSSNAGFVFPVGVGVDNSGTIYVADRNHHRVQVINSVGQYVTTLGVPGVSGSDNSHFNLPHDVAVDPITNNIFVADTGNDRIQVFDSSFNYLSTIGGNGNGLGNDQFSYPTNISVDVFGNVYVSDKSAHRVQVFTPSTLSTQNIRDMHNVSVFPNPAIETLNLKTPFSTNYITINNILGQQVLKTQKRSKNFNIDISGLTQGLYLIEIKNNYGVKILKRFLKN